MLAAAELVGAIVVLAPGGLAVLLIVWVTLAFTAGWAYLRERRYWSALRLALTHDLVERMTGHGTRLVQGSGGGEECQEQAIAALQRRAARMDRWGVVSSWLVPRGWVVAAAAYLARWAATGAP